MSTNPFKSFTPFLATFKFEDARRAVESEHPGTQPVDPHAGSWSTMHLCSPIKGEGLFVSMGDTTLAAVQFNERILPGKVRDEEVAKAVASLEKQQGHKISKKGYAQLRDQVEFDMLPRAFIRRTVVPVIFRQGYMLICTSSAKRCDDAVGLLTGILGERLAPWKIQTGRGIPETLTTLAKDGYIDGPNGDDAPFNPSDNAVLKGSGKKLIRIKDKDISEADVQALLKQDYSVQALGVQYGDLNSQEVCLTFTVNHNLVFTRLTLPDVKVTPVKEDFFGFAELCASTYTAMLYEWVLACGGLAERPQGQAAADDGDEL